MKGILVFAAMLIREHWQIYSLKIFFVFNAILTIYAMKYFEIFQRIIEGNIGNIVKITQNNGLKIYARYKA